MMCAQRAAAPAPPFAAASAAAAQPRASHALQKGVVEARRVERRVWATMQESVNETRHVSS